MNDGSRIPVRPVRRRENRGLSLIEILVALAIAALLLLGLSQIFVGSKQAYSVQTAVSRSQENARFIMGYLENNVRMAGYYGCGNESSIGNSFYNHLSATAPTLTFTQMFQRPIQGFQNNACALGGTCSLGTLAAGTSANWAPAFPNSYFPNVLSPGVPAPISGSDILILRVLSSQSTPALGPFNPAAAPTAGNPTFKAAPVPADSNFIQEGGIYAITNCAPRADIFKASAGTTSTPAEIVVLANSTDNPLANPTNAADTSTWAWTQAEGDYKQPPNGQLAGTVNGEVYKAQYMAIYVGLRPGTTTPALYVQQPPINGVANTQEIADGVEHMQLSYGVDTDNDGVADRFESADTVQNGATDQAVIDANWRKVVSVHIGLLMRAQDQAGVPPNANGNVFAVNTTQITAPPDGRYRDVYETTIALRNRLSNF
jgi:type IV pilus assembly protein PilW